MSIQIIRNDNNARYRSISGGRILEVVRTSEPDGELDTYKYAIVNAARNISQEIMPKLAKYDFIEVVNAAGHDEMVYFTGIEEHTGDKIFITLYQYNADSMQLDSLYSYEDSRSLYPVQKKVKIFVLDEDYILVQSSFLRSSLADNCQGYFDVEMSLFNTKVKNTVAVNDENLIHGIEYLIPAAKNVCVIKTGFSIFKDNLYQKLEQRETVPEVIGLVNTKQLVTDILLKQRNVFIDIIDKVQYTKTIPRVEVREGCLIYSRVSPTEQKEELFFYNFEERKADKCIKNHVTGEDKLAKAYILMDEPYVEVTRHNQTDLHNVSDNSIALHLNKGAGIKDIIRDYVVIEKEKNSILGSQAFVTEIYGYPEEVLIVREKAAFSQLIIDDEDNIYLFTD